jgi:peptidoglycan/LPS O-acetylase OafA/YrhL
MIRLYPFIFLGSILGAMVYLFYDLWYPIANLRPIDYSTSILSGFVIFPYPLIGGLIKNALFPTNIPEWSLFFEILASMTLFFVVKKRIKSHYIVIVAFIMLIFALLWYKHLNLGVDTSTILGGFPRTAFAFFGGVLLYQIFIDLRHVNVVGITMYSVYIGLRHVKFLKNSWLMLSLTTMVFCLPPAPNLYTKVITGPFLVLLLPYLILSGLANDDNSELRPVFVWLGRVSYGIYAIHWPVYHLIVVFLNRTAWADEIRNAPLILACGAAAVVIAAAHLLTSVIDEPIRRWLSSSRNRAPSASHYRY